MLANFLAFAVTLEASFLTRLKFLTKLPAPGPFTFVLFKIGDAFLKNCPPRTFDPAETAAVITAILTNLVKTL